MNELVSILIPTFNRKDYTVEAIESALNQNYSAIEIVVVDNCSTDGTWEKLNSLYSRENRVRLYQGRRNAGPVINWYRCAKLARGNWSKLLFSDDLLLPDCINMMTNYISPETAFVYSSCIIGESIKDGKIFYERKTQNNIIRSIDGLSSYADYKDNNLPLSPGAALFRTSEIISSLKNSIKKPTSIHAMTTGAGPDLRIFLDHLIHYDQFSYVSQPQVFFRSHADSFTFGSKSLEVQKAYSSEIKEFFMSTTPRTALVFIMWQLKNYMLKIKPKLATFQRWIKAKAKHKA